MGRDRDRNDRDHRKSNGRRRQAEHPRSTQEGGPFLGTVKWFNNEKGYGFIQGDHDNLDVFVHWSGIDMDGHRKLVEGQRVQYYVEKAKNDDRLGAVEVKVL